MNWFLHSLGLEAGADAHRIVDGHWQWSREIPPAVYWLVIALGLLAAVINFWPKLRMRTAVRFATFALRLGMLGLLLAVLGGLEWHVGLELNQPQRWVALLDDSASMGTKDIEGESRWSAARKEAEALKQALDGKVDLTLATFSGGSPEAETPGAGPTPFSQAVSQAALSRSQVDRLVVLTDGRDSDGRDLAPLGEDLAGREIKLAVRMFGSNTTVADVGISAEPLRNVLRLGEELVIRGSLHGQLASGEQTLTLTENGQKVGQQNISDETNWRFEIRYTPKKKGQLLYAVELAAGDAAAQNNTARFTVSVVDEPINVLLIEGFPRYEFKLLKGVLEVDPLVKLVSVSHLPGGGVYVQGEPLHRNPEAGLITAPAELFKYDVVVLRDVARSYFRAGGDTTESRLQYLVQFVTRRGGGLVCLGGQDVFRAGAYQDSSLAEVLPFDLSDHFGGADQFEGKFFVTVPKAAQEHPLLRLLPDSASNKERLGGLRELDGVNNVGRFKPLATPLMTRMAPIKEGEKTVEKEVPVLGVMSVGEGKVLAGAVDTLWRWQLQPEYDDPPLAALLANSIRYLAPPPDRKPSQANVSLLEAAPQVGQEVTLTTTLRDKSFDPITGAELLVKVHKPDGSVLPIYPRDLPEEPGVYQYRVRVDQAGPYKVTALYEKTESTREFVAGAAAGELADLSADRPGMQRLTSAAKGEIMPGDVSEWLRTAKLEPAQRPALRRLEVWNSPFVLIAFIALVSLDCFLRKRQGLA